MSDEPENHVEIHGFVSHGFDVVREGAGGSLGFADPQAQIGYGYIPNRKGVTLAGDPRDVAIRKALYSATPAGSMTC